MPTVRIINRSSDEYCKESASISDSLDKGETSAATRRVVMLDHVPLRLVSAF